MLTTTHTRKLTAYFEESASFFYILLDEQERIIYLNPFFKEQFRCADMVYGTTSIHAFVYEDHRHLLHNGLKQCRDSERPVNLLLSFCADDEQLPKAINWEITTVVPDDNDPVRYQWIGTRVTTQPETYHPYLLERYRAYEQSAEGLWMFETPEPIPANTSPGDIIRYWEEQAFLADCNDNTAQMYGFEKAVDMLGTPLRELMNFKDLSWISFLEQFIANGFTANRFETQELDRFGNTRHFLNNMQAPLHEGMIQCVWGTQQDITTRKMAEAQLQQSELFYRNLFANALDGILITDENGIITFASPSITPILGYTTEEGIGNSTFDYVHPDDRESAMLAFREELDDQAQVKFISVRLRTKSGEWRWCIIRGHNLMHNEYIRGMIVYFYDDTLRKQTEAALIESEQRFRLQANVLNNVTDVILTTDMNRVITSWNKVLETLTGVPAEEAIGKWYRHVIESDYYPSTREEVIEIILKNGIWRGEVSFKRPNGDTVYLLHTISLLYDDEGTPIGLLGIGKDITERKQADQRLLESERFYRNMSYYSFDGIVMSDNNGRITYCGPSVPRIAGYQPEQLLNRNIFEFIHPDDVAMAADAFGRELNRQSVVNYLSLRLLHASGIYIWCTVRAHNHLYTDGFHSMVVYFTNDTKRKEAEDKLRKSEQDFRTLIYNLSQGVLLQDKHGVVTICNQAALDILGMQEDELVGKSRQEIHFNVIAEDGTPFPPDLFPNSLVLQYRQSVRNVVMGVERKDNGELVWLLVNAEPILDQQGELVNVICSFADITEQKRLSGILIEQELQKQRLLTQATIDGQEKERLEIGKELHDNINQHLTTTRLYLEVAREKATGEVLEMINFSHRTLVAIINEIRSLSQSLVPPTLGDLGLVESIQELCDSLKRAHKFQVDFFARHFNEDKLPVNVKLMIFRIVQEQVNNIVRHASARTIQIRLQSDAENILLSVADDGNGFDMSHYRKGLGFNNITSRVALFHGSVDIDSAPGRGCALYVTIPLDTSDKQELSQNGN